jgi:prepilin-type N-terminal cleavage/methylation domain-containing protein
MNRLRRQHAAGFTLIEIMVVVLILVLLMGIALPAILYARKKAKATRTQADMQTIVSTLEEYKKDHHGQYPQSGGVNTGFAVLARELMGIFGDGVTGVPPNTVPDPTDPPTYGNGTPYKAGDCVQQANAYYVALADNQGTPPPGVNWAVFSPLDNFDGPGQRFNGVRKGPYIQPEKFHHRGCALLDPDDNPILYFPSAGRNPVITKDVNGGPSFVARGVGTWKFSTDDNVQFFYRVGETTDQNAVPRIQGTLGDLNFNGIIDNGETATHNGTYLLWAAGPDGFFGPKGKGPSQPFSLTVTDVTNCDDLIVTP